MTPEKLLAPFMAAAWLYRRWWDLVAAWAVAVASGATQPPPCDEEKWK